MRGHWAYSFTAPHAQGRFPIATALLLALLGVIVLVPILLWSDHVRRDRQTTLARGFDAPDSAPVAAPTVGASFEITEAFLQEVQANALKELGPEIERAERAYQADLAAYVADGGDPDVYAAAWDKAFRERMEESDRVHAEEIALELKLEAERQEREDLEERAEWARLAEQDRKAYEAKVHARLDRMRGRRDSKMFKSSVVCIALAAGICSPAAAQDVMDVKPASKTDVAEPAAENTPDPNAEWPAKGDTIYVSATLSHVEGHLMAIMPADQTVSELPACVPLLINSARPHGKKGPSWAATDPVKSSTGQMFWFGRIAGGVGLQGPWLPRMHHTEAECEDAFARLGEPKVIHAGQLHRIIPPQAPAGDPPPTPPSP